MNTSEFKPGMVIEFYDYSTVRIVSVTGGRPVVLSLRFENGTCGDFHASSFLKFMDQNQGKPVQACRICGCTENNCRHCIEKTGEPCSWISPNVCSACADQKRQ